MRRAVHAVSLRHKVWFLHRTAKGVGALRDDVDLRMHDLVALEEIELYAEVLSAVATADRPLSRAEIDEVLGLRQHSTADASAN
jgi:hypothetical protein